MPEGNVMKDYYAKIENDYEMTAKGTLLLMFQFKIDDNNDKVENIINLILEEAKTKGFTNFSWTEKVLNKENNTPLEVKVELVEKIVSLIGNKKVFEIINSIGE